MWEIWSYNPPPLTDITSINDKFKPNKTKQDALNEIKWIMACNNLLAYPDFNDKFKIHTNARYLQLLSVIIQEGKLISFYSIKLADAQKRHTVTEKELLTIAETLK